MTTKDIALQLEAWVADVTGFSSYPDEPRSIQKALPLVISEVLAQRVTMDPEPKLPGIGNYQQQILKVWEMQLMLMVDPTGNTWNASQALYDAIDALETSVKKDPTLSGRVYIASPLTDTSYDPPEVEHADGTVARQATFLITVGEPQPLEV